MILCLTPNPAIDRTLLLPSFAAGNVHRAQQVLVAAGGKGLNVARSIRTLGGEVLCMGFTGGHSGKLLAKLAQDEGLNARWTVNNSETRTCTIMISPNGDATVVNEPGLPVSPASWKRLQRDVRSEMTCGELVCISGSLPPQSAAEDWRALLQMLVGAGKQVWVDTSGAALSAVLECPGVCVKVNAHEIGAALGFAVDDPVSAKRALVTMGERGLRACVITLGALGALLATAEGRWYAEAPRLPVVSSVGSGDAFLAGLVHALDRKRDWSEALCDAVAAGSANALSPGSGRFTLAEFQSAREQVRIESW